MKTKKRRKPEIPEKLQSTRKYIKMQNADKT